MGRSPMSPSMNRRTFTQMLAAATLPSARQIAGDVQRPRYHFLPKANWMNDPNGLIYHQGKYHMFFQWGPDSPQAPPKDRIWGHAVSQDLVHWKHRPATPMKWSGSVVIDDGVPTAIYTGAGGQDLATSDDNMIVWRPDPANPILKSPPPGMQLAGWRDPSVWREADGWYMLLGAGYKGVAGTALLYRSADLRHWDYLHPLAAGTVEQRRRQDIQSGEDMWECPDFFPLGGRHVLLASLIAFPPKGWYDRVAYYIGTYRDHKFECERMGDTDMGWVYAGKTLADARGRRIYFAWIRERRPKEEVMAAGWSGVMSLPRVLTLRSDGLLGMEPLPELELLRGRHTHVGGADISGDGALLKDVRGDSLEIVAEFEGGTASEYGVRVRCSADGKEEYRVNVTGRRAHIFVDASVIEVFWDGRGCLTDRYYPKGADSLGVGLFAKDGKARLKSLDVWEVNAISGDRLTS
jgi:beta-fructofuranosidase